MALHYIGNVETLDRNQVGAPIDPARGFLLSALSSMDRIPCFELGDVGSIPAGPANSL